MPVLTNTCVATCRAGDPLPGERRATGECAQAETPQITIWAMTAEQPSLGGRHDQSKVQSSPAMHPHMAQAGPAFAREPASNAARSRLVDSQSETSTSPVHDRSRLRRGYAGLYTS